LTEKSDIRIPWEESLQETADEKIFDLAISGYLDDLLLED